MTKITLIRGLPGSGKSTLAKKLAHERRCTHVEADMYCLDENGVYIFDPSNLTRAHEACQNRTDYLVSKGKSVIVSNTFTRKWEMKPYYDIAAMYTADIEVRVARGAFKNIHNVPQETIERMRARWEA